MTELSIESIPDMQLYKGYADDMKIISAFFFLIMAAPAVAQSVFVLQADNCYDTANVLLTKGDTLTSTSYVVISQNGILEVRHQNGWRSIHTSAGRYSVASMLAEVWATSGYRMHDSVLNVLKGKPIYHCNFPERLAQEFQGRAAGRGIIRLNSPRLVGDSATFEWRHQATYTGGYYVVFKNLYDEYVGIESTAYSFIRIPLELVKRQVSGALVLRVYSEDCHESGWGVIKSGN